MWEKMKKIIFDDDKGFLDGLITNEEYAVIGETETTYKLINEFGNMVEVNKEKCINTIESNRIYDADNWVIEVNDNSDIRISYFEDGHYKDEIIINILDGVKVL